MPSAAHWKQALKDKLLTLSSATDDAVDLLEEQLKSDEAAEHLNGERGNEFIASMEELQYTLETLQSTLYDMTNITALDHVDDSPKDEADEPDPENN